MPSRYPRRPFQFGRVAQWHRFALGDRRPDPDATALHPLRSASVLPLAGARRRGLSDRRSHAEPLAAQGLPFTGAARAVAEAAVICMLNASVLCRGISMKMIFLIVAAGSAVALAVLSMQPRYTAHQAPSAMECATANCAVDCATATCTVVPAALPVALFPSEFTSEFTPESESTSSNGAVDCPNPGCAPIPAAPPVADPPNAAGPQEQ
jgi:hypothetical protein